MQFISVDVSLIDRPSLQKRVTLALQKNPIAVLQGPRQSGKTTLARSLRVPESNYFDLHDPLDQIRLEDNARSVLGELTGLVVIDEAQQAPELFPILRVLADRADLPARFLLLGSASFLLMQSVSETLAGRAEFIDMGGLNLKEVGSERWKSLWMRGGFPRAFQQDSVALKWRLDYIQQFIARDLRQIAETKMTDRQMRRLVEYIAATNGRAWNSSQAASVIGVNYKTIQRHIEILRGAFLIRELPVFDQNAHKRLRKASTIFLRDSGLVHALLQIGSHHQLLANPALGASFEGFALEQVISYLELAEEQCFTWSLQSGAEIDLVFTKGGQRYGIEFKHSETPRTTRSFTQAFESLGLRGAAIVHGGSKTWQLAKNRFAVSIQNLDQLSSILGIE